MQRFDIYIRSLAPGSEDPARRMARAFGLNEKSARALIASLPRIVKRGVPVDQAQRYARRLLEIGADHELRPCPIVPASMVSVGAKSAADREREELGDALTLPPPRPEPAPPRYAATVVAGMEPSVETAETSRPPPADRVLGSDWPAAPVPPAFADPVRLGEPTLRESTPPPSRYGAPGDTLVDPLPPAGMRAELGELPGTAPASAPHYELPSQPEAARPDARVINLASPTLPTFATLSELRVGALPAAGPSPEPERPLRFDPAVAPTAPLAPAPVPPRHGYLPDAALAPATPRQPPPPPRQPPLPPPPPPPPPRRPPPEPVHYGLAQEPLELGGRDADSGLDLASVRPHGHMPPAHPRSAPPQAWRGIEAAPAPPASAHPARGASELGAPLLTAAGAHALDPRFYGHDDYAALAAGEPARRDGRAPGSARESTALPHAPGMREAGARPSTRPSAGNVPTAALQVALGGAQRPPVYVLPAPAPELPTSLRIALRIGLGVSLFVIIASARQCRTINRDVDRALARWERQPSSSPADEEAAGAHAGAPRASAHGPIALEWMVSEYHQFSGGDKDRVRSLVSRFKAAGAPEVYVGAITEVTMTQIAGELIVVVPTDPSQRAAVIEVHESFLRATFGDFAPKSTPKGGLLRVTL